MATNDVKWHLAFGKRNFYCRILKKNIILTALDLDDGCTGYGYLLSDENLENILMFDLSCLDIIDLEEVVINCD